MVTQFMRPDPAQAKEFFQKKLQFTTGPVELDRAIRQGDGVNIVDVRAAEDYQKGHVPGSVNLPKEKWDTREGLSRDKTNVVYCYTQQCHLAAHAALQFASAGYPVMEMEGGFEAWKENDLKVEKTPLTQRMRKAA
jgi:rhodanese-related sulfurtransferase